MANRLQRRALKEAAGILGSEARLCEMLGVAAANFPRWLEGAEPIPEAAFAMLLEFLSAMESETLLPH